MRDFSGSLRGLGCDELNFCCEVVAFEELSSSPASILSSKDDQIQEMMVGL